MQKSENFTEILQNLQKFAKFCKNFAKILKIQLTHFVDFEKRCKMSIWLQKSALIQPRTSSPKFAEASKQAIPTPGHKSCSGDPSKPSGDGRKICSLRFFLGGSNSQGGKRARIIWQEKKRLACEDLNQKMKSENSVPLAVVPILQTRRASSNKTHIVHIHGSNGKRIHKALHPSKAGLWPVPLDE